jgi:RNA polymerase sigma-70 factor (ECF subfamily)
VATCEINELVQRCLTGDEAAIRQFVDRFERVVFAQCLRMLSHRQDAEDATQESLVRIVRNLHRWDSSRPFMPWVMSIASNRCRTLLARRTRRPLGTLGDLETPAVTDSDAHEMKEELQLAVGRLREEYRNCFELFYLQELSCAEISGLVGVPEGTVKTWLHRARKELAEALRRRGFKPEGRYELFPV